MIAFHQATKLAIANKILFNLIPHKAIMDSVLLPIPEQLDETFCVLDKDNLQLNQGFLEF
jgi:hypothetical protein